MLCTASALKRIGVRWTLQNAVYFWVDLECIGFMLEKAERGFYTCLLPDYLALAGLLILFVLPPVHLEMNLIYR